MSNGNILLSIRKSLSDKQREILNCIWQYYIERREWIPAKVLYHKHNRKVVSTTIETNLGGILCENNTLGEKRFALTFIGILLTDQGPEYENLLIKYLEYVRQQYAVNPEISIIQGSEVAEFLCIDGQKSILLATLIRVSDRLYSGGSFGDNDWSISVPRNVDELNDSDSQTYFENFIFEMYDPNLPIEESKRLSYR